MIDRTEAKLASGRNAMRHVARPSLAVLAVSAILMVAGGPAALAQGKVGVNAAVNQNAQGTPPSGAARQLVLGQEVVHNERIATAKSGRRNSSSSTNRR